MKEGSLGITVQDLTADQAEDIAEVPWPEMKVLQVYWLLPLTKGKFGEDALGMRANDVVLEINREPIRNSKDFREMESRLKSGMDVVVLVARQRRSGFDTHFLAARMP